MSSPEPLTERALERRLKRHLMKEPQSFMAVCAPGTEGVLETEVQALPEVREVTRVTGGIEFRGRLETLYHANLRLRTAHRVLLRIDEALAQSYPMLFAKAQKIPWELYLGFNPHYRISVSARESRLRQHKNIAKAVHDAVREGLEPLGLKPELEESAPTEVLVRMYQDRATFSLNTSGEHLHKRGYRRMTTDAPVRETLAAAILLASGYETYSLILDPMCGSGTFLIEAALLARKIEPGLGRSFAFEAYPVFQASKWERFKREAEARTLPQSPIRLIGIDEDEGALAAARENARLAGVADSITFMKGDALTLRYGEMLGAGRGLIVTNPPYGARLGGDRDLTRFFRGFSEQLKREGKGFDAAILTPRESYFSRLPLRPLLRFSNGGIRVTVLSGSLDEGVTG